MGDGVKFVNDCVGCVKSVSNRYFLIDTNDDQFAKFRKSGSRDLNQVDNYGRRELRVMASNFYYRDGVNGQTRPIKDHLKIENRDKLVRFNCALITNSKSNDPSEVIYFVTNAWEEGGRAPTDDAQKVIQFLEQQAPSSSSSN